MLSISDSEKKKNDFDFKVVQQPERRCVFVWVSVEEMRSSTKRERKKEKKTRKSAITATTAKRMISFPLLWTTLDSNPPAPNLEANPMGVKGDGEGEGREK